MASYSVRLRSGALMPLLGIGTFMATDQEVSDAVLAALETGYRHVDTAYSYRNEKAIGQALQIAFQKGLVKREELFITTKLPPNGHAPDKVKYFMELSLKDLQLTYVDLYLIHCPTCYKYRTDEDIFPTENGKPVFDDTDLTITWKAMEELVDAGLAKSIGISNFNSQQVKLICDHARIKPSTNQVECHIYFQQEKLRKLCQDQGIVITAFSPFGSPAIADYRKKRFNLTIKPNPSVLNNEVLVDIGKKYNKTSAHVALRWLIQRGIVAIPKSSTPTRIQQNFQIFDFDLADEDMKRIQDLDEGNRFSKFDFIKGQTDHPFYPFDLEF